MIKEITMKLSDNKLEIIKYSLDIESIKIDTENKFVWASGYRMPIYNDNRLLLSNFVIRKRVTDSFIEMLFENNLEDVDIIAGTATSGIPFATSLADAMEKPLVYVRRDKKGYGANHNIEGYLEDYNGKRAVLIEDVFSTGRSAMKAAEELQKANIKVEIILSIFDYEFTNLFKEQSIYTLTDLINYLKSSKKHPNVTGLTELLEWKENPFTDKAI